MLFNSKEITIDSKLLSKIPLQELNNLNINMILFTKSTKALIFKINNSEQKIKNSKDNKGPKTKTKLNKPSLNFTWSKIPWKNNVPSSKWKKNSFNNKLTDIKNAVILLNHKTEKFDNLTRKFLLVFKIFNPNSNKSANK